MYRRRKLDGNQRQFGRNPRGGGKFKMLPIVLFILFAIYYYKSNQQVVPYSGRSQMVSVSDEQIRPMALSSYRQILSQSNLITSGPEYQLIQDIAKRLIAVSDLKDLDWEVNLIQSDQANAFALPGGKIAVYTGLLPVVQNADGLAAVIGHEIAHVIAKHGAERMSHEKLVQFGTMAIGMSVGEMDPGQQKMVLGALGLGAQYGFQLPFSRKHETEADYIGLVLMSKACFNPEEASRVWERMSKAVNGKQPEFMSTHPSPESRIEQLRTWTPEALLIKDKHCKA